MNLHGMIQIQLGIVSELMTYLAALNHQTNAQSLDGVTHLGN